MLTDIEPNAFESEENEQITQRRNKLNKLRQNGNPFPNDFKPTHLAGVLHREFGEKSTDELVANNTLVKVAGRIMTRRIMGKASFIHLQDRTGKIQLYIKQGEIPDEAYEEFKDWDLGDIIGVQGSLFKTKTGELTIKVSELKLLVKSLRPLPDKFHGLSDQELCFRRRYLDILVNEKSRKTFYIRSKVVAAMREFFNRKRFFRSGNSDDARHTGRSCC